MIFAKIFLFSASFLVSSFSLGGLKPVKVTGKKKWLHQTMEYAFETEVSSVICTCNPNNKCKTKKKNFFARKKGKIKGKKFYYFEHNNTNN